MRYDTPTVDPQAAPSRSSPRGGPDRLYDRFVRDLFTRVVPGLLLLLSVAVSVTSFGEVGLALERATTWMWLIAFGAGWLTGFGLLEIGRRFNLALLSPEAVTDEQCWTTEERFRSTASRRQHAEYERLVTVRDGMAIASVSLFLSMVVLGVDFVVDVHMHESPWSEIRNGATALVVLVGVGVALQLVHRAYVRRTWRYLSYAGDDRRQGRGPAAPPLP
jgi:hypothetical protein